MPAHILGIIGSKVECRIGYIDGFTSCSLQHSSMVDNVDDPLGPNPSIHLLHLTHHKPGRDHKWGDAVDPDPMSAELWWHRSHNPYYTTLRQGVGVLGQSTQYTSDTGRTQDRPSFIRDHDSGSVLDPRHNSSDVDGHDSVEVGQVEISDARRSPAGNAGIVEHDVQAAEPGDREVNYVWDIFLLADVTGHETGLGTELLSCLLAQVTVDVGDYHLGPIGDESGSGRLTDAAGCSSD